MYKTANLRIPNFISTALFLLVAVCFIQPQAASAQFTDCSAITGMPQAECQALVDLYDSTNGASWTTKTGWKQTTTPCTWFRVTCSGGHVTQLQLYGNNLVGTIPASIGNFNSMTYLYLYENQLSGTIPETIGNLSLLRSLVLSNNQLTGSIPESIGNITTQLTVIKLSSNQLSGSIPAEIGTPTQLITLWLHDNQLNGSIPVEIGNLTQLTSLYLYNNQLNGSIPTEIGNLTKLTTLHLYDNQISGSIPTSIGNLVNLTELRLNSNQLGGSIPSEVGNLTNLTTLYLYGNQLSGSIPTSIGNLTKLITLYLYDNQLSGSIPTSIGNLTKLTRLYLYNNQLSGSMPNEIGNLTKLTGLYLSGNQLSGTIPLSVGNLTDLEGLNLYDNQLSGSIPNEIGNLTNLTTLNLYDNQLSGSIPNEIGNLTNLTTLKLNDNQLSRSIPNSIGNLANLQTLSLQHNELAGNIPAEIGNLNVLTTLDLRGNQFTEAIPVEIGSLANLIILDLSNNQLSGGIPAEISNLTKLTTISFHTNLLSGSIPAEIGNLTKLTTIYLYNNSLSGNLPANISNLSRLRDLQIHRNKLTGEIPPTIINMNRLNVFEFYQNYFLVSVSGRITNSSGEGIEGATITVTGTHQTIATTAADGTFTLQIPDGSSYTLTPVKQGYSFSPTSLTGRLDTEMLGGLELTGQDFTGNIYVPETTTTIENTESTTTTITTTIPPQDSDNDGVTDSEEEQLGLNPNNPDSDHDGVSDSEEIQAGTHPLDHGSQQPTLPTTLCSEWNGYLGGLYNVLEHTNLTKDKIRAKTRLWNIKGQLADTHDFILQGNRQSDLLVHNREGWEVNSYGQICTSYQQAQEGSLDGRMVYYKSGKDGAMQFAYALPFERPSRGVTTLGYNNHQPSLDPKDSANLVANWVQVANLSGNRLKGTLYFYALDGSQRATQTVNIQARTQYKYPAHRLGKVAGLLRFVPKDHTLDYQLSAMRYLYDNPGQEDSFASAYAFNAKVGSGQTLVAPVDTSTGNAYLELSNTLGKKVYVAVKFYDKTGKKRLYSQTHPLKAYSSQHVPLDTLLANSTGLLTAKSSHTASLIGSVVHYGRTENGGVKNLYAVPLREPVGTTFKGSYNTYLNQGCTLYLANSATAKETVTVSMKQNDGTNPVKDYSLAVPGRGVIAEDLCAKSPKNVYGVVTVTATKPKRISSLVVRNGEGERYKMATPMR